MVLCAKDHCMIKNISVEGRSSVGVNSPRTRETNMAGKGWVERLSGGSSSSLSDVKTVRDGKMADGRSMEVPTMNDRVTGSSRFNIADGTSNRRDMAAMIRTGKAATAGMDEQRANMEEMSFVAVIGSCEDCLRALSRRPDEGGITWQRREIAALLLTERQRVSESMIDELVSDLHMFVSFHSSNEHKSEELGVDTVQALHVTCRQARQPPASFSALEQRLHWPKRTPSSTFPPPLAIVSRTNPAWKSSVRCGALAASYLTYCNTLQARAPLSSSRATAEEATCTVTSSCTSSPLRCGALNARTRSYDTERLRLA